MRHRPRSGSSPFVLSRSPRLSFTTRTAVNLLLTPALAVGQAKAASIPDPVRSEGTAAAIIRPAQGPSRPSDASMRFGRHATYDRFAFEWSSPVDVDVQKNGGELVVTFDRAADMTPPPAGAFAFDGDGQPQMVFGVAAEDRGRRYRIEIDPDSSFELHRWNGGRLVVVDITPGPAAGDQAAASDGQDIIADDEVSVPVAVPRPRLDAEEDPSETASEEQVEVEPDDAEDDEDADDAEDDDYEDDGEEEEEEDEDEATIDFETEGAFELEIAASLQFGVATATDDRVSDDEDDRGYGFFTDTEVEIDAFTEVLEDVYIGASLTLEADADVSDDVANADDAYIYLYNGFGTVELGRTTGAEDDMALGADTIAAGTGGIDGDTANLGDTQVDNSGDAAKVSYFTPRIGGFQLGMSYSPDLGDAEDANDRDDDLEHHIGVGLNVVETYGEVEFALATVGSFGNSEEIDDDDLSAYSIGGTMTLDQIEVGASYGQTVAEDDFDFATLGITVGFGEAFAGVGYNYLDEKGFGVTNVFVISGDTPILPGVDLQGDVSYADPEGEKGDVASVLAVAFGF